VSRREPGAGALRRAAPVLAALLASFLLYYRRFMDVVVEAWDRMVSLKGAAAVGPMTAPVREKLERLGGGDSAWIAALVVLMVAIGIVTWPKDRPGLARVLFVWILVTLGFTLLGLITPVQVRSTLSARWALAALGASGGVALWSRGGAARGLASALLALTAIACWMIAIGFLPAKPA
jgi:uncharacterized protein YggT (Ycf19 family)